MKTFMAFMLTIPILVISSHPVSQHDGVTSLHTSSSSPPLPPTHFEVNTRLNTRLNTLHRQQASFNTLHRQQASFNTLHRQQASLNTVHRLGHRVHPEATNVKTPTLVLHQLARRDNVVFQHENENKDLNVDPDANLNQNRNVNKTQSLNKYHVVENQNFDKILNVNENKQINSNQRHERENYLNQYPDQKKRNDYSLINQSFQDRDKNIHSYDVISESNKDEMTKTAPGQRAQFLFDIKLLKTLTRKPSILQNHLPLKVEPIKSADSFNSHQKSTITSKNEFSPYDEVKVRSLNLRFKPGNRNNIRGKNNVHLRKIRSTSSQSQNSLKKKSAIVATKDIAENVDGVSDVTDETGSSTSDVKFKEVQTAELHHKNEDIFWRQRETAWRPPLQRPVNKVIVVSGYGHRNPAFDSQPGFGLVQGSDDSTSDWWSKDVWSNTKTGDDGGNDVSVWFQTSEASGANSANASSSTSSSSSSSSSSNPWGGDGSQSGSKLDSFSFGLWQTVADRQSQPAMTSSGFNANNNNNNNNGMALTQQGGGFTMGQAQGGGSVNGFLQGGATNGGLMTFGATNSAGQSNSAGAITNGKTGAVGGGVVGASSMGGGGASSSLTNSQQQQQQSNMKPSGQNGASSLNQNNNNGLTGFGQSSGSPSYPMGSGFGGQGANMGGFEFSSSSSSGIRGSPLTMGMNPGFGGSQGNPSDNAAGMFFTFAQSQSDPGVKTGAGFGASQGGSSAGSKPSSGQSSSGFPMQGMGSSGSASLWGSSSGTGGNPMTGGVGFQFANGMSENSNAWQFSGMTNPGFSDPGFGGSQNSGGGLGAGSGSMFNFGSSPGFGGSQGGSGGVGGGGNQQSPGGGVSGGGGSGGFSNGNVSSGTMNGVSTGGTSGSTLQGGSLARLLGNASRASGRLNNWLEQADTTGKASQSGNGNSPFSIPQFLGSSTLDNPFGKGPAFTGGPTNSGETNSQTGGLANGWPWTGMGNSNGGPASNSGNPFSGGNAPFSGFTIGGGGQVSVPSSAAKFNFGEGDPSKLGSPNGNSPLDQNGGKNAQGFPGIGSPFNRPQAGNSGKGNGGGGGGMGGQFSSPFSSVINNGGSGSNSNGPSFSPFSSALSNSSPFGSGPSSPFGNQMNQVSSPFSSSSSSSGSNPFAMNNNPSSSSNPMGLFGQFLNPSESKSNNSNPLRANLFSQSFNFGNNFDSSSNQNSGPSWMFAMPSDRDGSGNNMGLFSGMFQGMFSSNRMPSGRSYLKDFVSSLIRNSHDNVRSDITRRVRQPSLDRLLENIDQRYISKLVYNACLNMFQSHPEIILKNGFQLQDSRNYLKIVKSLGDSSKIRGLDLGEKNSSTVVNLCRTLTSVT